MKRTAFWVWGTMLGSLLLASMTGCSAQRAEADFSYSGHRFYSQPAMVRVADTDVYYGRDATDYDVYQFEGTWYLNENNTWYRADSWRGPFVAIDADALPYEVTTVPAQYRRNWVAIRPDYRDSRYRDLPQGYWASGRTFNRKPEMAYVPGSSVRFATRVSGFDLYRLHGTWYLVDDGQWFRSTTWRGPFLTIRTRSVPRDILNLPTSYRHNWSNAPAMYQRDYDRDRSTGDRDDYNRTYGVRYWSSGRTFTEEPSSYMIPNTSVYFVEGNSGYDMYRFGNTWYLVDNGDWFRADSWRGPFISIQTSTVPRTVLTIPVDYRHYWGPDSD